MYMHTHCIIIVFYLNYAWHTMMHALHVKTTYSSRMLTLLLMFGFELCSRRHSTTIEKPREAGIIMAVSPSYIYIYINTFTIPYIQQLKTILLKGVSQGFPHCE